ncbi:fimbrial protein [Klebsiella huaxiensis]|uniref:Fimbrial protein n=1 Tax=Klebsiella huaxiensis TaxID=2153354 RepID=A0ABT6EGK4_9ENTR|nr:fimbrial protein [Klebsiella huaxiensis]MDG1644556.1 fimbrial protein [Klebsiella huaxiensis]QBG07232.1 fimbrial protein [Klebsiella huaxiensis]VUS59604.1 putative minor fimbrial subunit LpfD [Klebsiella huaxiensis]VUS59968.1 putative minor fimbrial subunit LpfD [Klebsiella huaxiensis]
MKRFSWGILAGLTALVISPQAMAATEWCETMTKAPFQDHFSFIETFTNPSQNQAGMEFPRLYQWNTGGSYQAKCDCETVTGIPILYKTTIPGLVATQTRSGLNYYRLNQYLEIASELYIAGKLNQFVPTPVQDASNLNNNSFVCNTGGTLFDTGSRGYISLYFTRPFVGQVTIPPTIILNVYGTRRAGSYSSIPMTQITMSGSVTVPQSCEINTGQPINVDFGDIAANNFKTANQMPTGFTPHTVNMTVACTNISAGVKISLSFQGTQDSHDNTALVTTNSDIAVRIENITGVKIPVISGLLPVNLNYSTQTGNTTMKIYPINTTGNLPDGGGFTATATIQAEIE